ncbi:MAG: DUF2269 domain-containing protein, partial [Comamonadaceae bacterium]|nr:DUF2269 domain-containing protein [Comamonadaceae bacterium]
RYVLLRLTQRHRQLSSAPAVSLTAPWLLWTYALYVLAGACWPPVVWLQTRMRDVAQAAVAAGEPLPPLYFKYLKAWTVLGVPAFFAFVAIFWLMVAKPAAQALVEGGLLPNVTAGRWAGSNPREVSGA